MTRMRAREANTSPVLKMVSKADLGKIAASDPIHMYYRPFVGRLYRRRVELCLDMCRPGNRALEIGFGSGLTFLNLHDIYTEIHGLDMTSDVGHVKQLFEARGITTELVNGNVLSMPYDDDFFDVVLLISILEHLKPDELEPAIREIRRVLRKGGQVVFGVPVERPAMRLLFRLMGYDIRKYHFSDHNQVAGAASKLMRQERLEYMKAIIGRVYLVGSFVKE